ncbi:MAG: dynamin family protein [Pseudomonadota bacterium]
MDKLRDAYQSLRAMASSEFKPLISTEEKRLSEWRARVAVVGQVKAGKSTFLGALIGQPRFLPSEVNPWTSVITNLHFGHPEDPKAGGVFHFFGEDDWNRIIEGDPSTRELAEKLLPGFKSEILERQVETMRARARKRLGQFYNVLLGREHRYDFISREILERYVCAGATEENPEDSNPAKAGRYSDITERADIFFPAGRFSVPIIFTDTPGVNDPFLVRDEFTCRALLKSDVFVMTLSAHQALTDVDIGLIRMLSAHKGKRIVIYINRIDELDDFSVNAERIQQDVRRRIDEAIDGRVVDVVIGSAYWAELATSDLDVPAHAKAAEEAAATPGMDAFLISQCGEAPTDPRQRLRVASGLVSVEDAIDAAIAEQVGQSLREESAEALRTISTAVSSVIEQRLNDLRTAVEGGGDTTSLAEEVRASLLSRSDAARAIATELNQLFKEAEADSENVVTNSWESFRRELDLIANDFIDRQTEALEEIVTSQSSASFSFDTMELRGKLGAQISQSFDGAREKLDFVMTRTAARANNLLSPLLGDSRLALDTANLPHSHIAPIFLTATQTMMLELTGPRGWAFWKSSRLSPEEAIAGLKRMILAEFYPSIENLAVLSHGALVERAAEGMRRLTSLSTVMVDSITERAREIDDSQEVLETSGSETSDTDALKAQLQREISDEEKKIEMLQRICEQFPKSPEADGQSDTEDPADPVLVNRAV